ncbi:MAG: hypothetical protein IKJ38_03375 [Alistipes sp.]|nr:hypothetical protein [Alistipes sp.]
MRKLDFLAGRGYEAPELEVISTVVEKGFEASLGIDGVYEDFYDEEF